MSIQVLAARSLLSIKEIWKQLKRKIQRKAPDQKVKGYAHTYNVQKRFN